MFLKSFRVWEYRSVWDSGVINLEDVTCLVGKNEAGKTTLLKALYCLSPLIEAEGEFDPVNDYPRREASDYQDDVEQGKREPAQVVCGYFELQKDDVAAVETVFGPKALRSNTLSLTKYYDNSRTYALDFDEAEARKYVIANSGLGETVRAELAEATSWKALKEKTNQLEASEGNQKFIALISEVSDNSGSYYAYNKLMRDRLPKFLYFDEYYQMRGHDNVQALISRRNGGDLLPSDHPLLGLINLAKLNLDDLLNTKRTIELVNRLEGASNILTRQILKYWSQNKHLQMKFDIRDARPEDPEGMQSGQNIWGRVYDQVHWATTELGSRSKGFVWFFSFLAWYEDVKRSGDDVILLLDEPGLSLHGRAQADLLAYIEEELRPHHQVIYSTHSPFMVDPTHFDRVRIIQDAGIDSDEPLPKQEDGTKVLTEVFDASDDSLFPLQGALGYDIHQTLFVGPNTLIVEGPSDLLYLQGMSSVLEREGRKGLSEDWTITPVGGSGKVSTFVSLLGYQKGLNIAALLDIAKSDRESVEALYKKKLLEKTRVITFDEFVDNDEADIEDLFEVGFYIGLVNSEYSEQLSSKLGKTKLNLKIPRILKSVEAYLGEHPLKTGKFGHFRPARYFIENIDDVSGKLGDETKDRFEALFKRLNELLS